MWMRSARICGPACKAKAVLVRRSGADVPEFCNVLYENADGFISREKCFYRFDGFFVPRVTKLVVGTGTETQFIFRGTVKPLRDWIQEVLINCLGFYTFSFGKLKVEVRVNSSALEAFTEGNILFRSLKLAPLKPSFNHITAHFADEDFEFVASGVAVYDVDHALLLAGGAGPQFLTSSVNLAGTFSKSQAGRIIAIRLREELGGITAAEWKAARRVQFRTTVLALNTEPGMLCSILRTDMTQGEATG